MGPCLLRCAPVRPQSVPSLSQPVPQPVLSPHSPHACPSSVPARNKLKNIKGHADRRACARPWSEVKVANRSPASWTAPSLFPHPQPEPASAGALRPPGRDMFRGPCCRPRSRPRWSGPQRGAEGLPRPPRTASALRAAGCGMRQSCKEWPTLHFGRTRLAPSLSFVPQTPPEAVTRLYSMHQRQTWRGGQAAASNLCRILFRSICLFPLAMFPIRVLVIIPLECPPKLRRCSS